MKVLLIEDSARLQKSIGAALKKSGYATDVCGDGDQGCWMALEGGYDVLILDLMLPGMDGLCLLRKVRAAGITTHILILTARDLVEDRVRGLEAGADDYLTKPFSLDELLARVGALVRRCYDRKNPELRIGNLLVDLNKHAARVADAPVRLAPREYRLLEYLAYRSGELATRTEIEAHLYEETAEVFSNVVDSTVSALRRKLAEAGCSVEIRTRRGMGYLLEEGAA